MNELYIGMRREFAVLGIVLSVGVMPAAGRSKDPETKAPVEVSELIKRYPNASAIRSDIRAHPDNADNIVSDLVRAVAVSTDNPKVLLHANTLVSEVLWELGSRGIQLSRRVANQSSETLLEVFLLNHSKLPDNGLNLLEFAIKQGESPPVKSFILDVVSGRSSHKGLKKQVLVWLYWGRRFQGDSDVFDALSRNLDGESADLHSDSTFVALSALSRVGHVRAVPILEARLAAVSDNFNFNKVSSIICDNGDPALMASMFAKLATLPTTRPTLDGDPTIGIDKPAVVRYIDSAEDQELEQALDALFRIGGHPPLSQQVLIRKLSSRSNRSRRAVLAYLTKEVGRGAFINAGMLNNLYEYEKREVDSRTVKAAKLLAESIRANPRLSK